MSCTLILENESGRQLNLSETANRIMFSKIEGLSPPAGTISTSSYAGMDGSYLNTMPSLRNKQKDYTAIAKEVIQGLWSNGAERKARLTAERYDYEAVQNKINEMLR